MATIARWTTSARSAADQPSPSMVYWGKYVQHDNNRDGIGKGLKLSQNVLAAFLDLHPTVLHDLHESVNLLYVSTGHGPVQPDRRSHPGQRVVVAGAERDHGDDQARRARRVDLQLLRRLGAELHVLDRRHAQLDRPLLRDAERRRQRLDAGGDEPRVVPPESGAGRRQVDLARQRQHAAVGAAHHAQHGRGATTRSTSRTTTRR